MTPGPSQHPDAAMSERHCPTRGRRDAAAVVAGAAVVVAGMIAGGRFLLAALNTASWMA